MGSEPEDPRRRAAVPPWAVDVGVAVVAFAIGALGLSDGGPRGSRSAGEAAVVLLGLAALALIGRRVSPLGAWALTSALTVGVVLQDGVDPTVAAPVLVALYTVGRSARPLTTAACVLVSGGLYLVALAAAQGVWLDERGDSPALPVLALAGAAAALGVAVRGQQEALAAARARARQAEQTREEEAVRRVTDERLRIARELHDVVAHHISVVNVQAGVARHLLRSRPDQAAEALTAVRDASRSVLTEMAAVVGLLRSEDGVSPAEPAPGLHRLPALLESLRAAGLEVTERTTGEQRGIPPIADLTAYRVVQEALTNALKHGRGTAELAVRFAPEEVDLEVRNPVGSGPPTPGGHGLVGMRERLDAVGGRLTAGPDGAGGWVVRAVVPQGPR